MKTRVDNMKTQMATATNRPTPHRLPGLPPADLEPMKATRPRRSRSSQPPSIPRRVKVMAAVSLILWGVASPGLAVTRTWIGTQANCFWSNTDNWDPTGPLENDDDLVFVDRDPLDARPGRSNTNDLSGLRLNSITFRGVGGVNLATGGYLLFATADVNGVVVASEVACVDSRFQHAVTFGVELRGASRRVRVSNSNGGITFGFWFAAINRDVVFEVQAPPGGAPVTGLNVAGANLVGSQVRKTGGGSMSLGFRDPGPTVSFTVEQGSVSVSAVASGGGVPVALGGPVTVGGGVALPATLILRSANSISDSSPVTVREGSQLTLENVADTIGPLTLQGGTVQSRGLAGLIKVNGDIQALADASPSVIAGRFSLGGTTRTFSVAAGSATPNLDVTAAISADALGVGVEKTGTGTLRFAGTNTYPGRTLLTQGRLLLSNRGPLGQGAPGPQNEGTVVATGTELQLNNAIVSDEILTAIGLLSSGTGNNVWNQAIGLDHPLSVDTASGSQLDLPGALSGAHGINKSGGGTLTLSGSAANTYAGPTRVNGGTLQLLKTVNNLAIPGDLFIGDGLGGSEADVVLKPAGPQQINDNANVILASSGKLDLAQGSETIGSLAGAGLVVLTDLELRTGRSGVPTAFSGQIRGNGSLTKQGPREFTLTRDCNNQYTGTTLVSEGTLIIDAIQPSSDVTVAAGATLEGSGQVRALLSHAAATVAPGTSPGRLSASSATLSSGSIFRVELGGPTAGLDHDQLSAGTVDITGAQLAPSLVPGFAPSEGQVFTIIDNTGASPVAGQFEGRPNGTVLIIDDLRFLLRYDGGTGNDVTLTVQPLPASVSGVTVLAGNESGAMDPNECGRLTIPIRNGSAATMTGVRATLTSRTPGVCISQSYSPYPDIPAGASRLNLYPYQISTMPEFICGTEIELVLIVTARFYGTFSLPVTMPSGTPSAPLVFDSSSGTVAIPDNGSVDSRLSVSGFSGLLAKVTVELVIGHFNDADLDVDLIGPDGTSVNLTSDNGGSGENYGQDCNHRTVFSDDASRAITAGTAPFVGSFKPEVALAAFRGKSGSAVNGVWTLRVRDDTAGNLGALGCWTLKLAPASCVPGSGPCTLCPGSITGSITASDPTMAPRLTRQNFDRASQCGVAKQCPPLFGSGPYHYDAYTFVNRNGADACVTLTLSTSCTDASRPLFSAAYLNSFDPADVTANYLGDLGSSPSAAKPSPSYSVMVPDGARLVVLVHEVNPGAGCDAYTLSVCGFDCPARLLITPSPSITPGVSRVRLDWPIIPPGFTLESAAESSGGNWAPVPGAPTISGDNHTLSLDAPDFRKFFRLRKP